MGGRRVGRTSVTLILDDNEALRDNGWLLRHRMAESREVATVRMDELGAVLYLHPVYPEDLAISCRRAERHTKGLKACLLGLQRHEARLWH